MLHALLTPIDYGVLLLYLAALTAVGAYFSGRQKDSVEFLLAGRALGWMPLGLSLAATSFVIFSYAGLPGAAYEQGLKCWIVPAALWLALPVMVFLVIPIYRGLGLDSLYEYLEQRLDARVRLAASLTYIAWRLLWLGGVLIIPCQALLIATGWNLPLWALIFPLGIVATLYTFLGGMRAVVWTGVAQFAALLLAVVVVIAGVWLSFAGGPGRVAELAAGLGRLEPAELKFSWTDPWTLWAALPHWILAILSFYVADQLTGQHYLSAKSANKACTAYLWNAAALTLVLPGLIYAGMCLFAYYYEHPQEMDPAWVVNLDNRTRQPLKGADGLPLLDPQNPQHAVTWESVDRLVAEGRILQPNNKQPFFSADELVDPETNRVRIEKLAMRKINSGQLRGEIVVAANAPQQMLARFVATRLGWGAAGLALAAFVAWALSAFAAGLHSIAALLLFDFHRRFGWRRAWLARRLNKSPDELNTADELQLARPLTLVLGAAATLCSVGLAQIADAYSIVVGVLNTFGGPLLAVFLLGMLTRRATATAALIATIAGGLFTVGITIANKLAAADVLIPRNYAISEIWHVVFGVLFTYSLGYALSFVVGKRESYLDLRGLVAGCGTLGLRATDEAHPLISLPEERGGKWK